ncbi:MAG: hypothetical protein Q8O86_11765 [Dehalococcoidia bacterium]|nr:hypothetical protein [Dehalococcoidia bacterium]
MAEALREWLEAQEDSDLLPEIEAARAEWEEKGGIEAGEFFQRLEEEKAQGKNRAIQG